MSDIYDIIILGGGIAGIYTTYKLLQKHKNKNFSILLLESSKNFGGRVYTGKYGLEAGAGRFSNKHVHLMKLIKELGLENKIKKSSASAEYFPVKKEEIPKTSVFSSVLEWYTGSSVNHLQELIATVIIASKLERKEYLQSVSFINYAKTILTKEETDYILDSFGYYSELVIMNAYDTLQLIQNLDPKNHFYTLEGGLSQIIERMIHIIRNKKGNILKTNHKVIEIKKEKIKFLDVIPLFSIETENGKTFYSEKIIAALPKQALEKIRIFYPLKSDLKKIHCAPLCRIYSKFKNGKWFENLPKLTTNNNLRMIIPIDTEKGTIMISYTDNKFADYWNELYKKKGLEKVNEKIAELVKESTQIDIPKPVDTMIYYWSCGVGYWGVGADSEKISQKMTKPFDTDELYICGEHYSERNQQWIEGALDTSISVLKKIY